jgi:hypothetical protein
MLEIMNLIAHDQKYYRTIERSDAPVENSIDRPVVNNLSLRAYAMRTLRRILFRILLHFKG